MRDRACRALTPFLLLALAACGSAPAPDGPTSIARSDVARSPASSVAPSVVQGAVAANNAFAVDLFGHVLSATPTSATANVTNNVLTSPLSASLALTMTYAGAIGNTASQMATALHFGAAAAAGSIFDGQNALSQALAGRAAAALAADTETASEGGAPAPSSSDYALQIVNSVWGQETYTWNKPFLDVLARDYGTGVYQEDFAHQFDPARLAINAWVSSETSGKIQDLLPPGALDDTTRMVLVNAVHLKLPWATPFAAAATALGTFTRAAGSTVSAPFMNQLGTMAYADDGKAQIVGLPLANNQVAVVVALPHGDLASYEATLTGTSAGVAMPASTALVALSLPKVSFTSATFSLAAALQSMGMTDAFSPKIANFTGLCTHTPDKLNLYIGDVMQKAMIAMEETGVEAAAATSVTVVGTAGAAGPPPTPVPVVVNRPYVVSIVDVPTGAVLFLGHITDPTESASP